MSKTIGLEGSPRAGKQPASATPPIVVRNRRFGRARDGHAPASRWWADGDPVGTAWLNGLSITFPQGETLFIDAVKAFRDGVPPKLAEEIRDFVKQEVNHTREHLAFNRAVEDAGYDLSGVQARLDVQMDEVRAAPPIVWLGVTVALEHFTALFAHEFLAQPDRYISGDNEQAELWRWHSVEEIEHKAVAYDTWNHATRSMSRWKRWSLRSALMLRVTRNFMRSANRDALDLLAQDGITGMRAKARLAWYLLGRPGMLRRLLPAWAAFFLPGFHPWDRDDSALIRGYDAPRTGHDHAAALMPAT
ncbi:metal-dependent hydrolase [Croceibacterium ferulae]|uniref:metal-dependent hydrolase n=1 Tax=Croceibacterium ferulae TaxID=1854641 RepID=UPI000EB3E750|nr:metal-dependent hydrolase [Croceibacterium ferulae]